MKQHLSKEEFNSFFRKNEIISFKSYDEVTGDMEKVGKILVGLELEGDYTRFNVIDNN